MLVAIVLSMAWPRLLSSLQFLPAQQTLPRLYEPQATEKVDIPALRSRTQGAISLHDVYSYHFALSLLDYVQASEPRISLFSKRQLLESSFNEAKLALEGAPLQPELWLRLAFTGAQTFVPASELVQYFQMAIWSGRVEPTNLIARLHIGFALMPQLDANGLSLLRDQVLLAWNLKQPEFRNAVRNGQLNYSRIVGLMSTTHPDVVREMEVVFGPVTL